jgi:hypothetical protein
MPALCETEDWMTTMTRGAARCGLIGLLFMAGCGDSPTRPSPQLPATFEMTANQSVNVPGTDLRLSLQVPPSNCGADASCLAWYGGRIVAQSGRAAAVEIPVDQGPTQRSVGSYTVSVADYLWGPARIAVTVEGP